MIMGGWPQQHMAGPWGVLSFSPESAVAGTVMAATAANVTRITLVQRLIRRTASNLLG
jgi:hypothetical protein